MARQKPKTEHDRDGELWPSSFVAVHTVLATSGAVLARSGQGCGRVPRADLAWLLADGHIRPRKTGDK